jgi:hypothetical protein
VGLEKSGFIGRLAGRVAGRPIAAQVHQLPAAEMRIVSV